MSGFVVLIVLFAALLHATWNAVVKFGENKYFNMVLVTTGSALISAVLLPFFSLPAPASWPYIGGSVVTQISYFVLIAAAYRAGDMSQVYPLMRGAAPILVAVASGPLIGESPPMLRWIGILCICIGIIGLSRHRGRATVRHRLATRFALINAVVIAMYTLIDGIGVRKSGTPIAYTMWEFLFIGTLLLSWTLIRSPKALLAYAQGRVGLSMIGGGGALSAYGLALWAMTLAPIAAVAALREISILFATAIAAYAEGKNQLAALSCDRFYYGGDCCDSAFIKNAACCA